MAEEQIIRIPLGAGIDGRTDEKHVRAPKLLIMQNTRLSQVGRAEKRYGSSPLGDGNYRYQATFTGTVQSVAQSKSMGLIDGTDNRLFAIDDDRLLAYNAAMDQWQLRGLMPLVDVSISTLVNPSSLSSLHTESAVTTDGLVGVVGDLPESWAWLMISDPLTGDAFRFPVTQGTTMSGIRIVGLGTSLYVFYTDGAAPHSLLVHKFNKANLPSLDGTALDASSTTLVSADLKTFAADQKKGITRYDVQVAGSKILVAYVNNASVIKFGYMLTDLTQEAAFNTETPAALPYELTVAVAASGKFAIAWGVTTSNAVMVRLYNADRTTIIAATSLESAPDTLEHLTAIWINTTTVHVLWDCVTSSHQQVRSATIDTSAVHPAVARLMWNASLASYPWAYGSAFYCLFSTVDDLIYYSVIRLGNPYGSDANFGPDPELSCALAATFMPGRAVGSFRLARPVVAGVDVTFPVLSLEVAAEIYSTRLVTLHYASEADHYKYTQGHVHAGGGTYIPGGVLWKADREAVYESGFVDYPRFDLTPSDVSIGGLTPLETYSYIVFFEWHSVDGEVEQSTGIAKSVTLGALDDTVTVTIDTLAFTNRCTRLGMRNLGFAVYRKNPGGVIFHRVSKGAFVATAGINGYAINDQTASTVAFVDHYADSTAAAKDSDYLSEGEVDNVGPPAHRVMAVTSGRAFLAGFALEDDLVWYSKRRNVAEDPLLFSDLNTIRVQAGDGPITALGGVGDSLVVFRRHQMYIVSGDGPGNSGTGGAFTEARLVSDGIGCSNPASVVRGPTGLLFQSDRGIYSVGPDGAIAYVGAPVERYTDLAMITSAVLVEGTREIRFTLTAISGVKTLVYHYDQDAWSTWTVGGYASALWNGKWVHLRDLVGSAYKEVPAQYYDKTVTDLYVMAFETPWLRPSELVSCDCRVRRILFAGAALGLHKPTVKISYDFDPAVVDTTTWVAAPSSGFYQFEARPSRQRVHSMKIRIEDTAQAGQNLANSFSLNEIALEVALVRKQPALVPSTKRAT